MSALRGRGPVSRTVPDQQGLAEAGAGSDERAITARGLALLQFAQFGGFEVGESPARGLEVVDQTDRRAAEVKTE